jgi:ferredoxin
MRTLSLTQTDLRALLAAQLADGVRVAAPSRPGVRSGESGSVPRARYGWITDAAEAVLDPEIPALSVRELFLPPTEPLFHWRESRDGVTLEEVPIAFEPRVVWGVRPCDAAALEILDRVMSWGSTDELWSGRREATTVVGLACTGEDSSCFCTAVGLAPDSTRGLDVLLVPVGEGYLVEVLTPRGEKMVGQQPHLFGEAQGKEDAERARDRARDRVMNHLDLTIAPVRTWLAGHFEHPFWHDLALRCHGCGVCAAVCPSCHCFDIVDEPEGRGAGTRRRNWDTCQTARFTLHGSGHNPRPHQLARFRQRMLHKFHIYPERFDEVLCVGCGRCARACPAGMDLIEVLSQVNDLARAEGGGGA